MQIKGTLVIHKFESEFPIHRSIRHHNCGVAFILSKIITTMAEEIDVFQKEDLPNLAFPIFEDIRRQGKLCDVTLKVKYKLIIISFVKVCFL